MAIDALPPSLAGKLKDFEDRIAILERSNKLLASTIVGGAFRILDPEEREVLVTGEYADSVGTIVNGLRVKGPNLLDEWPGTPPPGFVPTILEVNDVDGLVAPPEITPWRMEWSGASAPHAKHTNPGDWFSYFAARQFGLLSRGIRTQLYIAGSASTTWEVRLWGKYSDLSEPMGSTPASISDANGHVFECFWEPTTIHPGVGSWDIYVQMRRTSGTGTAFCYTPEHIMWGKKVPLGDGNAGALNEIGTFTP